MGKLVSSRLPSRWGEYTISAFGDEGDAFPHVVLHRGLSAFDAENPVPVRIHSECMTGDVFGSARCDCGEQLSQSLEHFKEHGGALVYLRQEGRGIGLVEKLRAYNRQDEGLDTFEANRAGGHDDDARNYDDAVGILKELGIENVLLLTNNPLKINALRQSGLSVVRQKCVAPVTTDNADYLKAKAEITGHLFSTD
jgi:GTP cyclohydrolase II